jgi:hypothetical protein
VRKGPLTLVLFVLRPVWILQGGRRDTGGSYWGRRTGDSSEHGDDDRVVTCELFAHLLDGGSSKAGDVFDHLLVVFLEVRVDSVVGHGRDKQREVGGEIATEELLMFPG